jgi:hypothetical protein
MSTEHTDESDLTFQAAITLDTTGDNPVVTVAPSRQVERLSVRNVWSGHQTLRVRLAIAVFFILLITLLLGTLLPGKSGMIARLLNIDTYDNGAGSGHE